MDGTLGGLLATARGGVLDLVDLVLPRGCAGCGRSGPVLCAECASVAPVATLADGVPVVAATRYEGAARSALLAYKERGRRDLAAPLAAMLRVAVVELLARSSIGCAAVVLVPVPSSRSARRSRGGDHLRPIARRAGVAPVRPALRLVRRVRDSAGLDIAARADNLAGAMAATPARGVPAVLVDDICTTGATLAEGARALRAAGWPIVGAAVVAATPRRSPRPPRAAPTRFAGRSEAAAVDRAGVSYPSAVPSGRSWRSGLT